jgi:1,4-alpha-glucan branching enzyme
MIKREIEKKSGQVKVTFAIPHNPDQARVWVVGDFNNWDPAATPMVKRANNTRSASITLAPGRYAFRYYTADGEWFNDGDADAYEVNEHGTHNAIVSV